MPPNITHTLSINYLEQIVTPPLIALSNGALLRTLAILALTRSLDPASPRSLEFRNGRATISGCGIPSTCVFTGATSTV